MKTGPRETDIGGYALATALGSLAARSPSVEVIDPPLHIRRSNC